MVRHKIIINRNSSNQSKSGFRKIIVSAVIILSIAAIVFTTIETASGGAQISRLERLEGELAEEKRELTEKTINNASLSKIQEIAGSNGFVLPSKVVYLDQEEPVANLP